MHLQKFHERYAKDGLQVLVISMHPEPETARKMTAELKATFPIFEGFKSDLGKQYAFG